MTDFDGTRQDLVGVNEAEPEIWRRLVVHDAEALRALYLALGERVFVAIRRQLGRQFSDDDVEDIWTAVFAYVWQHAVRYDPTHPGARFDKWVLTVARWQIATYLRATRRSRESTVSFDEAIVAQAQDGGFDDLFAEEREIIELCRPSLTLDEQRLYDLRVLGYDGAELAGFLRISEAATRKRVERLKDRLRGLAAPYIAQRDAHTGARPSRI